VKKSYTGQALAEYMGHSKWNSTKTYQTKN